jgi:hypothetical protein
MYAAEIIEEQHVRTMINITTIQGRYAAKAPKAQPVMTLIRKNAAV